MRFALVLTMIVVGCPMAAAGVDQDTPVARIVVADFENSACANQPGPCLFQVRNVTRPGDMEADLRMNIRYAGVGPHLERAQALGVPAPDEDFQFNTSTIVVEHPIFLTLDQLGRVIEANDPVPQYFGVWHDQPHPDRFSGYYTYGPSSNDTSPHYQPHPLMTGGDEGMWQHDQIGPLLSEPYDENTDHEYESLPQTNCDSKTAPSGCYELFNSTEGPYHDLTPRLRLGLAYETTQGDLNGTRLSPPQPRATGGPPAPPGRADPIAASATIYDHDARGFEGAIQDPWGPSLEHEHAYHPASDPAGAHRTGPATPPLTDPISAHSKAPLTMATVAVASVAIVLFAFAFYSRITSRRQALEHPLRARIFDAVRASPGIHEADIVTRVGASRGSVRNHVAVLCRLGFVRVESGVARNVLYPVGVRALHPPDVASYEHRRRVLAALAGEPSGLRLRDVTARLSDFPRTTLVSTIERLIAMGRVRREVGASGEVRVRLAADPA